MNPIEEHAAAVARPLIPQPLRAEIRVEVQLPPEVRQLAADLHEDRTQIAIVGGILIVLAAVAVLFLGVIAGKYLFTSSEKPK